MKFRRASNRVSSDSPTSTLPSALHEDTSRMTGTRRFTERHGGILQKYRKWKVGVTYQTWACSSRRRNHRWILAGERACGTVGAGGYSRAALRTAAAGSTSGTAGTRSGGSVESNNRGYIKRRSVHSTYYNQKLKVLFKVLHTKRSCRQQSHACCTSEQIIGRGSAAGSIMPAWCPCD